MDWDDLRIAASAPRRLHNLWEQDGLASGKAQYDAVFEDRDQTIWAGTLELGIARFDGLRCPPAGTNEGIRRGQVRGFADGDAGPIVAIADYGLFARDGQYRKLEGIPAGYVSSPVRTADGALWFSVLHKGVCRLQHETLTVFGPAEGLTDDTVWALLPGQGSEMWAGAKTGAFHWDGVRWQHIVDGSAGPSSNVTTLLLAQEGGTFLGTANGLVYRRDGGVTRLSRESGLPADVVLALQQDARGDLWLATSRGICRIRAEQLASVERGSAQSVTPELFTQDDGLFGDVLPIGQVLAARAHDGRIWFATSAGPAVAETGTAATPPPNAVVDGMAVDDSQLPFASTIVAPGRQCAGRAVAPRGSGWPRHFARGK